MEYAVRTRTDLWRCVVRPRSRDRDAWVVTPRGEIDMCSERQLLIALRAALYAGRGASPRVTLDLRHVRFADCALARAVAGMVVETRARGGALSVENARGTVASVLRLTGLDNELRAGIHACGQPGGGSNLVAVPLPGSTHARRFGRSPEGAWDLV